MKKIEYDRWLYRHNYKNKDRQIYIKKYIHRDRQLKDEFVIYPVLYDNWLFLTLLKKREEEKENEAAKPFFFQDRFEIHQLKGEQKMF